MKFEVSVTSEILLKDYLSNLKDLYVFHQNFYNQIVISISLCTDFPSFLVI